MRWGVGAGASRLVSGTMTIHRRLEQRLAAFEQSARSACCSARAISPTSGAIGALAGRGDAVFSDELNHASIIDGCRCSRAEVLVYRHRDVEHLDWLMRRHGGSGRGASSPTRCSRWTATSPRCVRSSSLAKEYGARTIVDEAHATGALGPDGRGALAQAGLEGEVDIVIGTLGKALGSYGAYACAARRRCATSSTWRVR